VVNDAECVYAEDCAMHAAYFDKSATAVEVM
jgi:hypothetical protein